MSERVLPQPNGDFEWVQASWGAALRCRPLAAVAPHCFSTRALGLEGVRDDDAESWTDLSRELGEALGSLVRLRQVHGADVFIAEGAARDFQRDPDGEPLPTPYDCWPEADITVSDDPSLVLSVRAADCVPVLLADRRTGAVAAVHAGWKGTAAGAVMAAVRALAARFGTRPDDVVAAVGPSIGACCYEVGRDLINEFADHPDRANWFSSSAGRRGPTGGDKCRLDLWRATRDQLQRAGVPPAQVHVSELCTFDHPDLFHSYRRDGRQAGRLVAAIRSAPGTRP